MVSKEARLKTEVASAAYAGMSDADIAAAINSPGSGETIKGRLQVVDLKRYLAANGLLSVLRDEASYGTSEDIAVTISTKALIQLFDESIPNFNPRHIRSRMAFDALVAAGVITAAQRTAIEAMGDTAQTRGQEIGVGYPTADDVMRARTL